MVLLRRPRLGAIRTLLAVTANPVDGQGVLHAEYHAVAAPPIFDPGDVVDDEDVLLYGQSSAGMTAIAPPTPDTSLMPIAWAKQFETEADRMTRDFATTVGAAVDFQGERLRRLLVNAAYWAVGLEEALPKQQPCASLIPANRHVWLITRTRGDCNAHQGGLKPSDFALDAKPDELLPREELPGPAPPQRKKQRHPAYDEEETVGRMPLRAQYCGYRQVRPPVKWLLAGRGSASGCSQGRRGGTRPRPGAYARTSSRSSAGVSR